MRNIIFIIAIFFWILNMISKSKKKQQQAVERQKIAALNKPVKERVETEPDIRKPLQKTPEEVRALFAERKVQAPATDYELAYASSDYVTEEKKPEPVVSYEPKTVSQFRKNYGMKSSLGTESSEEKEAYDKDKAVIPQLSLTSGGIKQYIVAAEILGKPKALRR